MTTSAATWFYRAPEKVPYLVSERVNTTFWDARIAGVCLRAESVAGPYVLKGTYNGGLITMEWQPNEWLRLTTFPAAPALANGTALVLRRKPFLSYEGPEGEMVWEWWIAGGDKRWHEMQGKPAYRNPMRLEGAAG